MDGIFEPGEYVVYGKVGVCTVEGRQMLAFGAVGGGEYYVLHPQTDPGSSIYVPCENEKLTGRLRQLLTPAEIDSLLRNSSDQDELIWLEDRNERHSAFHRILTGDDRSQVLRLIRCLYTRKQEKVSQGKHLSMADEAVLMEGIRLVEEEFSVALHIPRREVEAYIRSRIEEDH